MFMHDLVVRGLKFRPRYKLEMRASVDIELGAVYRRRKLELNASLGARACRRDVFCRCALSDGNQQASSTTHCPRQWPRRPARWLSTSAVALHVGPDSARQ